MKKLKILLSYCLTILYAYGEEPNHYGWDIPGTSINIGGYMDAVYDPKAKEKFLFDNVALFVSAEYKRFNFLSELKLLNLTIDKKPDNKDNIYLNVERLNLSYALTDTQTLTVGKFNSDMGYWNQSPVNILQATTTSPHIIEPLFPSYTTGIMFKQYFDADYLSVTMQNNKSIGNKNHSNLVNEHYAVGYYQEFDNYSWRVSSGMYSEETQQNKAYYLSLGTEYIGTSFTLQAELYGQKYEHEKVSYNTYIQGVWNIYDKHDLVVRTEYFDAQGEHDKAALLGYVYRPTLNTAFKCEYVYSNDTELNRVITSFSVLF